MTARALLLAIFWALLSFYGTGACTAAGFSRASDKASSGAAAYGVCLAPCALGCITAPAAAVAGGEAVHDYFSCLAPCAVTCAAAAIEAHFRYQAREKPKAPPELAPPVPPDGG